MSCWKCGAETPEGVIECEEHCQVKATFDQVPQPGIPVSVALIDWNKVATLDDMLEVLKGIKIQVIINSPEYQRLYRYLQGT